MNKIIIYFSCMSLSAMAVDQLNTSQEISMMHMIEEQLKNNLSRGGSTVKDVDELLIKYQNAKEQIKKLEEDNLSLSSENSKLAEENISLKRKFSEIDLDEMKLIPRKRPTLTPVKSPKFDYSPVHEPNLIYTIYITDVSKSSLIPHELRIDMARLNCEKVSDANLDVAFLEVEMKLRAIIRDNPDIVRRTIYVGQTKGELKKRFKGHLKDANDPIKKVSSNKVLNIEAALEAFFNVRISYVLRNVENYLDHFECLVADLFLAQLGGGSAVIANRAAWDRYLSYKNSSQRREALESAGLLMVVEDIAKATFRSKVGLD